MKRYEVIGIPLGAPFSVLTDHVVGDVIKAKLDEETERILVGAGALRILPETPKAAPKAEPKSEKKDESSKAASQRTSSTGSSGTGTSSSGTSSSKR